jgi:SAM-dependent methyltransferase
VLQGDARALPFKDGRFAVVLLFTVLSSLGSGEDVRRVLVEARRVLRSGGLLLCYEPRLLNPFNRRVRRVGDLDFNVAGIRPRQERRLTLLPPLARALGRATAAAYPRLASVPMLRSHRLVARRKSQA